MTNPSNARRAERNGSGRYLEWHTVLVLNYEVKDAMRRQQEIERGPVAERIKELQYIKRDFVLTFDAAGFLVATAHMRTAALLSDAYEAEGGWNRFLHEKAVWNQRLGVLVLNFEVPGAVEKSVKLMRSPRVRARLIQFARCALILERSDAGLGRTPEGLSPDEADRQREAVERLVADDRRRSMHLNNELRRRLKTLDNAARAAVLAYEKAFVADEIRAVGGLLGARCGLLDPVLKALPRVAVTDASALRGEAAVAQLVSSGAAITIAQEANTRAATTVAG